VLTASLVLVLDLLLVARDATRRSSCCSVRLLALVGVLGDATVALRRSCA